MTTTYMSLTLPTPGVTPPGTANTNWAPELNAALTSIDAHDHSSGKGALVPSAGLNINADLNFGGNNAYGFRSVRMTSQVSTLISGSDLGCTYNVNGDLYYNNNAGTPIKITSGSVLNVSSGALSATWNPVTITATTTILPSDQYGIYFVDTTAARTINLPAASAVLAGRYYVFKDINGNAETNKISIVPNGADTVEGVSASYLLRVNRGSWAMTSNGTNGWYVSFMADNAPGNSIAIGTSPSVTGNLRMSSLDSINWRTNANNGDFQVLWTDSSDAVHLGPPTNSLILQGSRIIIGSGSASVGQLALPNGTGNSAGIWFRNAANSGNYQGLAVDASNNVTLGDTNTVTVIQGTSATTNATNINLNGTVNFTAANMTIASGQILSAVGLAGTSWVYSAKISDAAPGTLTIQGQSAWGSATTFKTGGSVVIQTGSNVGSIAGFSNNPSVQLQVGSTAVLGACLDTGVGYAHFQNHAFTTTAPSPGGVTIPTCSGWVTVLINGVQRKLAYW